MFYCQTSLPETEQPRPVPCVTWTHVKRLPEHNELVLGGKRAPAAGERRRDLRAPLHLPLPRRSSAHLRDPAAVGLKSPADFQRDRVEPCWTWRDAAARPQRHVPSDAPTDTRIAWEGWVRSHPVTTRTAQARPPRRRRHLAATRCHLPSLPGNNCPAQPALQVGTRAPERDTDAL